MGETESYLYDVFGWSQRQSKKRGENSQNILRNSYVNYFLLCREITNVIVDFCWLDTTPSTYERT
jgi:hypothetical protein